MALRPPAFFRPLLEQPGLGVFGGAAENLLNWGAGSSLWMFPMATSCCGIEFMATAASRVDVDRMGTIVRGTPRQCDVMVVAGTITVKMAPRVKKLWEQMPEPKWCIAMGSCAISGDFYRDIYSVVPGIDTVVPVDVYVPGCPPSPEALMGALLRLKEKIIATRAGSPGRPAALPGAEPSAEPSAEPMAAPRPPLGCVGDPERDPQIEAAQLAEAGHLELDAEAIDVPLPVFLARAKESAKDSAKDFAGLLGEFGVSDGSADAPPLVDKTRHLELARRALALGYRQFGYVVASHWPAGEGEEAHHEEAYEVAYGLRATGKGTRLAQWRVRTSVHEPIDSLTPVFAGANWAEREQYDLVGVRFAGHPDLRRILLPETWQGHPLRRDYAIDTRCSPWR